jgi:hypothetical protein
VRASLVVVGEVSDQDAPQVSCAEDKDVIQALTADRADEPLREGILPRAARCREDFLDPHPFQSVPKLLAVSLVAIAQEIGRRGVVREGIYDLLGGPVRGGVFGHVEVDDASAAVSEHDENEEHAQACSGTVKKSIETKSWTWLARNVRQVCEGGVGRFGSRRDTVRSATWMPSLRSSP